MMSNPYTGGYPAGYGSSPQAGASYPQMGAGYPPWATGYPPTGPAVPPPVPSGAAVTPTGAVITAPTGAEESYIENILRMNLGKVATVYMTFENNREWNAKIFRGVVEAAGRDHIIISDPQSGRRYVLLMVNLDYITFEEPLQYAYPYAAPGPGQPGR